MSVLEISVDHQNLAAEMSRIEVEQTIEQPREIMPSAQSLPERIQPFVDEGPSQSE